MLWGLDERYPQTPVWGRDIETWLINQQDGPKIAYPTIDDILARFEDRVWLEGLFEQFTGYMGRPQRKYHQLTEDGRKAAIEAIQTLRGGRRRPPWLLIPELTRGQQTSVTHPHGFELTPPAGSLKTLDRRPLRAVRAEPG